MTRIAFVSCANIEKRGPLDQPAWHQVLAADPDLLLLLGDNTYMNWSEPDWEPQRLKKNYAAQWAVPAFKQLIDSVPTLAIWDDHDTGPNDSCGAEMPAHELAESRQLFNQYMGFAKNNNRPHMYCSHDVGDVRVIMLDVRSHRTYSGKPGSTVLGKVQEEWLWHELARNPKPYTLVCSGSVINRGPPGHALTDYPAFYQRLVQELRYVAPKPQQPDHQPRKVLFLSGDIHNNRWKRHPGFFEATSSGVACVIGPSEAPTDNWGLLTFGQQELRVDLNGHAPSRTYSKRIRLSDWKLVA